MSTKWNGWFTGAAVTAVLAIYLGWVNEHFVYDSQMHPRYSCGAVFAPEYPKDGLGPCTDILNGATWVPWLWIAATVVLATTGYLRNRERS